MDGQKKPHWGITNPISEAHATPKEDKLNDDLIRTLTAKNVFESPEGTKKRGEVLDHIQKVVLEFIRRVGKQKGLDQSVIDKMGGKIFTFGSYALGVHGPSSDIDAIVVAPKQVTLYDYFQTFEPTFREMSNPEDIEELVPVSDAYVPIIKMEYSGVSIDLIFCSLPKMASIPADMKTIEKHNLEKLDEASMRAVNGPRVKVELLELVPQQNSFKNALRAIKLWANERGIYGNVYGYPGGVAWAIMVARICQLYPYANGATIVSKFFNLMFKWGWPRPVLLKHIEDAEMGLRVWNPQIYHKDRADLMPIITPAFPSMNSTYTITPSTLTILKDELGRASQIMEQVLIGHKQWDALFERHTFFTKDHKYYLSVVATSRSKELNATFSGLVGSKVRLIAKGIDDGQTAIDNARPYVKSFTRLHRCKNEDQIFDVSQGSLAHMIPASEIPEDGTVLPNGDESIVYTTTFYIGLTLPAEGNKSLDISYPVATFKGKIEEAKEYDDKTMCVKVIHTRNTALPDDVFLPGEVRPKKPTKEKKKKDAKSVKRHFAETGLDDSGHSAAKRQQSEAANGLATPTPA